jgi:hypothetical protein
VENVVLPANRYYLDKFLKRFNKVERVSIDSRKICLLGHNVAKLFIMTTAIRFACYLLYGGLHMALGMRRR